MIDQIVYECIKKHEGGEKFFDALDDLVRSNSRLLSYLIDIALDFESKNSMDFKPPRINVIASGKFGAKLKKLYPEIFLVNGNLRPDGNYVDAVFNDEFQQRINLGYTDWVFVDDSYFNGITANKVRDFVEYFGGYFIGITVAYDGSRSAKRSNLKCLYRYHKIDGETLNG